MLVADLTDGQRAEIIRVLDDMVRDRSGGTGRVGAMTLTPEAIATAFSGHRFAEAYPALHEDLRWTLVGSSVIVGREAAIEACESTLAGLADTTTRFVRFDTIVGADAVAVDAVAEYESAEGAITVASCDLYQFRAGQVVAIRSYTVEVSGDEQD